MRRKIEERRYFTKEEKSSILKKSGSKCSHCGKKLSIDTMTVEHVVPISKGGTNNDVNLVALCDECNINKIDYVVNPADYYKYIKPKSFKSLMSYFNQYCEDVKYIDMCNFFSTDYIKVPYKQLVLRTNKRTCRNETFTVNSTMEFKRAVYSDLDEVYYFLKNYSLIIYPDKELDIDYLKGYIEFIYTLGCIMFSRDSIGNISSVFFLKFDVNSYGEDEKDCKHVIMNSMDILFFLNPAISIGDMRGRKTKLSSADITMANYSLIVNSFLQGIIASFHASESYFLVNLCWYGRDERILRILSCSSTNIDYNDYTCSGIPDIYNENCNIYSYCSLGGSVDTYGLDVSYEDTVRFIINGSKFIHELLSGSNRYETVCDYINIEYYGSSSKYAHEMPFEDALRVLGMFNVHSINDERGA